MFKNPIKPNDRRLPLTQHPRHNGQKVLQQGIMIDLALEIICSLFIQTVIRKIKMYARIKGIFFSVCLIDGPDEILYVVDVGELFGGFEGCLLGWGQEELLGLQF